jgi:hypothetical protein
MVLEPFYHLFINNYYLSDDVYVYTLFRMRSCSHES